jgi:asparagine synthase (glutamine-hydrolysing)
MANSVEGRYPFLDYRVIEFAASLPPDFKMAGLNEKYILKKMMDKRLPESVLKRPKQAYRAPLASGFFSKTGGEYIPDLVCEKGILETGIFNPKAIQKLFEKTRASSMVTETENMALAGIISTQILVHQYILKDRFRPVIPGLYNCRVVYEENPMHL